MDLAASLRTHASDSADFSRHGNADVCMHAGGLLRPSQTTGSMLVRLAPGVRPEVFVTATSAPCLSLYQPLSFQTAGSGGYPYLDAGAPKESAPWHQFEAVHQLALRDQEFARELRASRDELEPGMFDASVDIGVRNARASDWLRHWCARARSRDTAFRWYSPYERFWKARQGC
jgi:dipeptidase